MRYLEIFDGKKQYVNTNGTVITADDIYKKYPATKDYKYVVMTDSTKEVFFCVENLALMRSEYNIAEELSEQEAIRAIEDIINERLTNVPGPSPEERIASALEFQNMMALPDVEEV